MFLLLKCALSDYKQYRFKAISTGLGMVISLSLFIVIELFVGVLAQPSELMRISDQYSHKIINSQGMIQNLQIPALLNSDIIPSLTPLNETQDRLSTGQLQLDTTVVGVDIIEFLAMSSLHQKIQPDAQANRLEISLNNAILFWHQTPSSSVTLANRSLPQPTIIPVTTKAAKKPLLVMDMALFQTLYSPPNGIMSLLLNPEKKDLPIIQAALDRQFPELSLVSTESEADQRIRWTHSLTYNLKFLALIAMVVSTCLMIQFFRFLARQRQAHSRLLYELGVSRSRMARVVCIEFIIISTLTFGLGAIVALGIGKLSLGLFNQVVSTFYFNLDARSLSLTPWVLLKAGLSVLIAFIFGLLAYYAPTHKKARPIQALLLIIIGSIGIGGGLWGVQHGSALWSTFVGTGCILVGCLMVSIGLIYWWSQGLKSLRHPRWMYFKMSRDPLSREWVGYGVIVFVIGLAIGLVLAMGVFVNSFRASVNDWLETVTHHDYYIQHRSNQIQTPVPIPNSVANTAQEWGPSVTVSPISRLPFIWRGVPTQLRLVDSLEDPNVSRFFIKEKTEGPLHPMDIYITEPFAQKHGLSLNDRITLAGIIQGQLRIKAIVYDYVSEYGQVIMMRNLYRSQNIDLAWHGMALKLSPSADRARIVSRLNEIALDDRVLVQSREALQESSMQVFDETFKFTWFVVFLTGGIAVFSLINLLTILCLDRKAELHQLWHIGLNHRRILGVISAQMLIVTVSGLILSMGLGAALYYVLVFGIQLPTFSWSIFLSVPIGFLSSILVGVVILALGVTAAFVSGHKALYQEEMDHE